MAEFATSGTFIKEEVDTNIKHAHTDNDEEDDSAIVDGVKISIEGDCECEAPDSTD
jgi:hypothetical protein